MSISKSANKYNRQSWENSEFPILCETCLGDNPYVRMVKDKFGGECNVCERPYTSFKWCPGKRMRHKTTVICQICAKLKNICQTCLFDLEFGLPVEVRDKVLDIKDDLPQSDANREYYRQIVEKNVVDKDETALVGGMVGKARKDNQLLQRIARSAPYYNRNRPHICSFWVKGQCNRGDACPYRHEMPSEYDSNFSQKAVRDRYYGVNDPLANKIMQNVNTLPKLEPPKNRAITTLCIAGINVYINETDIYNHFYQYGQIKRVSIPDKKKEMAFVTFNERKDAEVAADTNFNKLTINNQKLRVMWAKTAQPNKNGVWTSNDSDDKRTLVDAHTVVQSDPHFPHPQTITNPESVVTFSDQHSYPSQNPSQLGSSKKD